MNFLLFLCIRSSIRIISVYDSCDLSKVLSSVEVDAAPATLIPFYDEDSSVMFLSAKVYDLYIILYKYAVLKMSAVTRTKHFQ